MQPFVERNVDRAIRIAREGALSSPPCGLCYSLLGFLLSIGYPPLVGAAHLTQDGTGEPRLLFLGEVAAHEPATDAARLPRDIGPPDPAAAAYALAYAAGDSLGILATAYLNRTGMIDLLKLEEPGPNQASALLSRSPKMRKEAFCDQALVNALGNLAASTVDDLSAKSWGPMPQALSQGISKQKSDRAFLEHILSDAAGSSASDLAKAANMLEAGTLHPEDLPDVARKAANVSQLRSLAASKGDTKSALRAAVEHLQENQTKQAAPLLNMVVASAAASANEDSEADAEMARYYLTRFAATNASDVTSARQHSWPHLVRAADLGREDAKLLVAHAFADGNDAIEAPAGSSSGAEAIRRYRELLPAHDAKLNATVPVSQHGALTPVQAFAAYNVAVLSIQDPASVTASNPAAAPSSSPEDGTAIDQPLALSAGSNRTAVNKSSGRDRSSETDDAVGICSPEVSGPQSTRLVWARFAATFW